MSLFTEREHGMVTAFFYIAMRRLELPNFENVFIKATENYAAERGARMAKRALRDGHPLDFPSYRYYSEWQYSNEYLEKANGKKGLETVQTSPDYIFLVHDCPWVDAYLELGEPEGARTYCDHLDRAMAKGFSTSLDYTVESVHRRGDFCLHCHKNACMEQDCRFGIRRSENIRDFDYHSAHAFSSYAATVRGVYGIAADAVEACVLELVLEKLGDSYVGTLAGLGNIDFTEI